MVNKYINLGNITIILCTYKHKTIPFIIDTLDFDLVNSYKNTWMPVVKDNKVECIVSKTQVDWIRKSYKVHNVLIQPNNFNVVDHINGCTLDNRKCNLRECTQQENAQNIHITKSLVGIRGITFDGDKYRVRVNNISYGRYLDLEKAKEVANNAVHSNFSLPSPQKDVWYSILLPFMRPNTSTLLDTLSIDDFLKWLTGALDSTTITP